MSLRAWGTRDRIDTLPDATVVTYLTLPVTVWSIFLGRPFRLPYVSSLLRQQYVLIWLPRLQSRLVGIPDRLRYRKLAT